MSRYQEMDIDKIKTVSIRNRENKMHAAQAAQPLLPGGTFRAFLDCLPRILAGQDLHELAEGIAAAVRKKKPILLMMGAHVVKVGLSPLVVDLMERGILGGIALNGAGAVHDVEMAYFGGTSEDVAESLRNGQFGMVRETSDLINHAVHSGFEARLGFGESIGKRICENPPPFFRNSILGQAYRLGIPATVHVAVGTDIVHQHPTADGAAIGDTSLRDFRIFTRLVSEIGNGGVVLLFGSSVVLPEVFLKALTVARNLRGDVKDFITANFDMVRHYRPRVNVVERPTQDGGKGFNFIGHHEILMPLLALAVKEKMSLHDSTGPK